MAVITTAPCPLCKGQTVLTVTDEEQAALVTRIPIQDALPERDEDFRELVLTGTHTECWDKMFPPEDEDEEE